MSLLCVSGDEVSNNESTRAETPITREGNDANTEQYEPQELQFDLDGGFKEPEIEIKREFTDHEEIYEDSYENYEQEESEHQYVVEMDENEQDDHDASEIEEADDDEIETTMDLLEDYQVDQEAEDYQVQVLKSSDIDECSGAADSEDEYDIVYEDDITMEEEPRQTKRKYVKQSRDLPKQFMCWEKNCDASFRFRPTMKKHMKQVHSIICTKSTCFICGDSFEKYADFLAHVKIHTRKSECDVCRLKFVNDEAVLKHKSRFHKKSDDVERNFECHVSLILSVILSGSKVYF